jgi:hypothetical protein
MIVFILVHFWNFHGLKVVLVRPVTVKILEIFASLYNCYIYRLHLEFECIGSLFFLTTTGCHLLSARFIILT